MVVLAVMNPPATQEILETQAQSLGQEDPLEQGMATHSSILAWRIPWAEEPNGPQSIGSYRVGHIFLPGESHGQRSLTGLSP